MKTIGLDIGTTTLSAVVYDCKNGVLTSRTVHNDSVLSGEEWERLQDPIRIYDAAECILRELLSLYPDTAALGVSCQMHGILYLDSLGNAVSPLYTWQDGRGNLPFDEHRSWAAYLSDLTGYPLSTGFGITTHLYNLRHNLVPAEAAVLCTIGDYVAMKLAGGTTPIMDATNAASLGLYDVKHHCFDMAALQKACIDPSFLPSFSSGSSLGIGKLGIPVYPALGDNQASFLGSTGGHSDALLVNMGTGGQISIYTPVYCTTEALETRPFPDHHWLLVGSSLCGGRSYALLEAFFRETVKMVTGQEINAYDAMARVMDAPGPVSDIPKATTQFQGTRKDPSARASIQNISADNFTPQHFICSIMQGMADELYAMYESYLASGANAPSVMIGSGNALRKNPHLCRIFEDTFGMPLILSQNEEEAACGAAIYAADHFKQKKPEIR